jgi:hypothetical protein
MISDKKRSAIHELLAGRKRTEIEKSVGVSHAQLWRWQHDPEFVTVLENERSMLHQRRADRLWELVEKSMEVATEALAEGDPKMAIDVLRLAAGGLTDVHRAQAPASSGQSSVPSSLTRALTSVEAGAASSRTSTRRRQCAFCGKEAGNPGAMARHLEVHSV